MPSTQQMGRGLYVPPRPGMVPPQTTQPVSTPGATPAAGTPWVFNGSSQPNIGGYNPNQYLSTDSSQQLGTLLAQYGVPVNGLAQTGVAGPNAPPPQNLFTTPGSTALNSGLAAQFMNLFGPQTAATMLSQQANPNQAATWGSALAYPMSPNPTQNPSINPQSVTPLTGADYGSAVSGGTSGLPAGITPPNVNSNFGSFINSLGGTGGVGGGGTPTIQPSSTGSSGSGYSTIDQLLAGSGGLTAYLQQIANNQGNPINTLPQWQAMMQAAQQQYQQGQSNLNAQFDVSGGRFSSAFGTAAQQYQNQANADFVNQLISAQTGALENAQGRNLSAAQGLASLGNSNLQQLSGQNFQSQLLQMQQALAAAQGLFGTSAQEQYGAAGQLAGQGASAASQLASQGYGAAGQLSAQDLQSAILMAQLGAQGAGALQQGAITGANNLYGGQLQGALANANLGPVLAQLGLSGNQQEIGDLLSYLSLGNTLGTGQYGIGQNAINNAYQQYYQTQPQYNPLLSYLAQAAFTNPNTFYPQYPPSQLSGILGGIGSILGAGGSSGLGGMLGSALGGLFSFF